MTNAWSTRFLMDMARQGVAAAGAAARGTAEAKLVDLLRRRINIAEAEVPKLLGLDPAAAASVIDAMKSQKRIIGVQRSDAAATEAIQLAPMQDKPARA
jgi:hypothetical protein